MQSWTRHLLPSHWLTASINMRRSTKVPSPHFYMGYASYTGDPPSKIIVLRGNVLDGPTLLSLLDSLQRKLLSRRQRRTTLVVHGGVIDVLSLGCHMSTSDIDYIERVLPEEIEPAPILGVNAAFMKMLGLGKGNRDARAILRECIHETASEFNGNRGRPFDLDFDWMNSRADILLPWRLDEDCTMFDPLVVSALASIEEDSDIIYDSPGLRLVGITSSWTIALKLQRFSDEDEADLVNFLRRDGVCAVHTEEEFMQMVEERLQTDCKEMEYELWTEGEVMEWRRKLLQCVKKARFLGYTRPSL